MKSCNLVEERLGTIFAIFAICGIERAFQHTILVLDHTLRWKRIFFENKARQTSIFLVYSPIESGAGELL